MGLFDKLKEKSRGVITAAKPEEGVESLPGADVRRRLLAIAGKGIETAEAADGKITVAWGAKIAGAGVGGAEYEYLYRSIVLELDEGDRAAQGICFKTTTEAALDADGLAVTKGWERGQHVGSETVHVLAWLGPHQAEGGADESGYKFSWSDLREPVIEAVTGAGWTYKPKKV
ncbi:MAG: hypothetical protein ACM3NV_10375 [Syntrophothermus sp.]